MSQFEEYVTKMEERRAKERCATFNAILARGLQERTHAEAVSALYASLTFVGGVSDILQPVGTDRALQPVF